MDFLDVYFDPKDSSPKLEPKDSCFCGIFSYFNLRFLKQKSNPEESGLLAIDSDSDESIPRSRFNPRHARRDYYYTDPEPYGSLASLIFFAGLLDPFAFMKFHLY